MKNPIIQFGYGSIQELSKLFPHHGVHILRIPEVRTEELNQIHSQLSGRVLSETVYQDGMPDLLNVQQLQNHFWEADIQVDQSILLGIGGGSLMDVAKVLRFKPDNENWLSQHLDSSMDKETDIKIPLVLFPTTAGTGSEVSPTATIWNFAAHKKHSFFGSQVIADVAIVDPSLCVGSPWILSRDAAVDALSHALESIWNRNRTNETMDTAIHAANNICRYLPMLKKDLNDNFVREKLSESALNAGLAMGKTQTALAHALSYADTLESRKSHGQSCAYWLPYVWQLLIDSSCEVQIEQALNRAVGEFFKSPLEMYLWLIDLGFSVYAPHQKNPEIENQVKAVSLSPRGKNFAGFKN